MKWILICLMLAINLTVNAAEVTKDADAKEQPAATASGSSTASRSLKWGGLAVKGGMIASGIPGSGVEAYMNLSPKFQVGLGFSSGTLDLSSLVSTVALVSIDKVNLNAQIIDVYSKYFVGNSFALTGGLAYRNMNSEINVSSSGSSISTTSSGSAITAKVGIGNYWTYDFGLTIGCEWVGYLAPLSSSYSSTSTQTGTVSSNLTNVRNDAEDLGKTLAKTGSVQLLNLTLGYSF